MPLSLLEICALLYLAVGSVMGTADALAADIVAYCSSRGIASQPIAPIDIAALEATDALLICTSTTGMGELPASIAPLYQTLTQEPLQIRGTRCAVIALGDSSYPNFAAAGHRLHEALTDAGAAASLLIAVDAAQTDEPWPLVKPKLEQWLHDWQVA